VIAPEGWHSLPGNTRTTRSKLPSTFIPLITTKDLEYNHEIPRYKEEMSYYRGKTVNVGYNMIKLNHSRQDELHLGSIHKLFCYIMAAEFPGLVEAGKFGVEGRKQETEGTVFYHVI